MNTGTTATYGAVLLGALTGCQRVVSPDVAEGPKRLVVEGRIELVEGSASASQTIRLTTTSGYFDESAPPPASGAAVRVTDEMGAVAAFTESPTTPGTYTTDALVGVVGRAYTLAIDYDGQHYEATDRMPGVAPIDSLYFAPEQGPEAQVDQRTGVRATIDFHDPGIENDWYLWEQFINGARVFGPDSGSYQPVAVSDQGLDGRFVRLFQPFGGIAIQPGSQILIRQLGLSESAYHYFVALGQQAMNEGSPFDVPASSVRGNVSNRSDSSRFPLGYFIATEVSEARRVYQP